jgi:hypothetical protein
MPKTLTFKQLCKQYQGPDEKFVEVKSRKDALGDITSKTSCCWGAGFKFSEFGDTGWIQLARPSPLHKGDITTVFVCKESLVKDKIDHYVPLTNAQIEDQIRPCPEDSNDMFWREDEIVRIISEHRRTWKKKHLLPKP